MHKIKFNAAVIGAGPAGIASVGVLLDKLGTDCKVLWFDPEFSAGRLKLYSHVPSNTRVCLFSKFARACASFKAKNNAVLKEMEQQCDSQRGCQLNWARKLCLQLTETLKADPRVYTIQGKVAACERQQQDWKLKTADNCEFLAEKVILATGSHPLSLPLPNTIDLDEALDPEKLTKHLKNVSAVAVWGSSHSAMLVLMNLLKRNDLNLCKVYNFYRSPLLFATIPDPIGAPVVIINDNTGLKGDVAEWVRTWSENAKYDGHVGQIEEFFDGRLQRRCLERGESLESVLEQFPGIEKHITAVGYARNPLPQFSPSLQEGAYSARGELVEGIFGFGIAFPERLGDGDLAVGMWKFMKYIQSSLQ